MGEDYTAKNVTFFVSKDGEYKKICVCDEVQEIHVEEELPHSFDLINMSDTYEFIGECKFCASLIMLIRLFGFYHGIKTWFQMKFIKE